MNHRFPALVLVAALCIAPLSASGRPEGAIQKSWDYPPEFTSLVVEADAQDILIKSGPRLTGRLIGDHGDSVRVVRVGDRLEVTARTDRTWLAWGRPSGRLELSVPEGLDLDISSASGAIVVQVAVDSLRARSASGDIEAAQGGRSADVDTASGTVRLHGFQGPVRAGSLSGNVILESITGLVQATTMSGNIEGTNLAPEHRSRLTVVSGGVDIQLAQGLGDYRVEAESVSGTLEVGTTEAQGSLTVGTGSRSLVVRSVSGDVRIR